MTEIDGIVGIYGAVDNAVQADPEARARVSRLLPLYRNPDLHWYDDFEAWLRLEREDAAEAAAEVSVAAPPPEPITQLHGALSELVDVEPRRRMRARRLFAIAVAARAFPEMNRVDSELWSQAVNTLRVDSLAESADDAQARAREGACDGDVGGDHITPGRARLRGPAAAAGGP